ncbi:MAG: helix-turn-helix domain-containing protein [Streptosporangiaceae bacterium]
MTHPRPVPPSGADAERAAFLRDLRALRDQAGLGPQELAARAHFPEETLTSAEAGPALPSLPVLQAYVRGCGAGGGSAEWEDRWRRLTQDPDVETALPTRAPTVSRAPAGPFGAAVGTGSVNPAEQAAIGFGLARVAAGLSPAGAGTSSWFSRGDLEQPESASTPSPSYPPAPAAQAPASPASSMPDSLTTWRPGTRETWGPEQQPGLDRRPGPDRQDGSAPSWGQAGQAAPSAPVSPGPGGFSQAPPSGASGFSRVPGPPAEFSPAPRPAGLSSAAPPSGFAPPASEGALPQRGGSQRGAPAFRHPESPGDPQPRASGAEGGSSGAQPAGRDDRAPATQKTTGPLHSAEAASAPGSRSGRTVMATVMIVLAVALVAALIWLALAS